MGPEAGAGEGRGGRGGKAPPPLRRRRISSHTRVPHGKLLYYILNNSTADAASTSHPASSPHTDRDSKYRAGRAQGAPGHGGCGGPPRLPARRLRAGCCGHGREAAGAPPRGACSGPGRRGAGKSALEHGLPRVQRLAPRGTGRGGLTRRRPGGCPPPPRLRRRALGTGLVFLKRERDSDFPQPRRAGPRAAPRPSDAGTEQRRGVDRAATVTTGKRLLRKRKGTSKD